MSREFSTSVALAASIGAAVGILLYLMLDDAANRYQASRHLQIIASEIRDQSIAAGAAATSEIRTEKTTTGQDPRRKLTIYMPERAADEFISQIESRTDVEIYTKSSRSTLPSHLTIDIYITMGAQTMPASPSVLKTSRVRILIPSVTIAMMTAAIALLFLQPYRLTVILFRR